MNGIRTNTGCALNKDVWVVYPSRNDRIGASRKIVIAKETGEIIADMMTGE
jgi:hypothetical protein